MTENISDFLFVLGFIYLSHGQSKKAVAILEAVRAYRPDDIRVAACLSYAYLLQGQFEQCLRETQRRPAPHADAEMSHSITLMQCRALWGLGRREEAIALASQSLASQFGAVKKDAAKVT
jgi:tetratricopeptide (TPR) repeat protein